MSYTDYDFPHTHMYDSDLRELIANMRKLEEIVKAFVATNSIELADPIQWNIASQYAKNNIVLDNVGNAYLSKQPVPAGIELDDEDYWLEIFNYTQYVKSFNSNLTYNIEENTTRASKDYAVGDWLVLDDLLYKVIAAIEEDELFVVNTNIQRFTVEEFCRAWVDYSAGLIQQYKDDIDASELAYRQQLAQDIATTTASLQAQLDLAISGATVDSEVINARLGADGNTYDTLGNAIRTQFLDARQVIPKYIDWQLNMRVATNTDPVGDPAAQSNWKCAVIDLTGIDCVTLINGLGVSVARPWCFIDNDKNIVKVATLSNEPCIKLYKPTGATKLVLNSQLSSNAYAVIGEYIDPQSIIDIETVLGVWGNLEKYMSVGGWGTSGYLPRAYRLYSKPYINLPYDITIKCNPGYRFTCIYDKNGVLTDSGWNYDVFKIPANTDFVISIGEYPEDTSITADVHEFSMNLMIEKTSDPLSLGVFKTDKAPIVMHRGYMHDPTNIPENSIPAFETAGELNAWMLETDIRETTDGYFVLMHDATVDRTTDGTGSIASMTYAETQELNLIGGDGTLKIPTLEQCLEVCKKWNIGAVLEVKGISDGANSLLSILSIVRDYGMLDKVIFLFNSTTDMDDFRSINTSIPICFNVEAIADYDNEIETARHYVNCGIAYRSQQDSDIWYPTSETIKKCHQNNLFVNVWVSSSWSAQQSIFARGADFVTSNNNPGRPTE